jgi:putative membrane protein
MKLHRQALAVATIEYGFLRRFPQLWLAAAVTALIPALYTLIYLSSVWNPGAHTQALAVGLVNLDQGIVQHGRSLNLGRELSDELQREPLFGYQTITDPTEAQRQVRSGQLAFALVIPVDFSALAIGGASDGGGRLIVHTSAGNSYEGAELARRFAQALEQRVNDRLGEARWGAVLGQTADANGQLQRLRDGVIRLHQGAHVLSHGAERTAQAAAATRSGAARLQEGVEQLTHGTKQARGGLRTLHERLPPTAELQRLDDGARALASGHAALGQGLQALHGGAARLREGLGEFNEQARQSALAPERVTTGLGQLDAGMQQLQSGLAEAQAVQLQLGDGSVQAGAGVHRLVQGLDAVGTGLHHVLQRLPDDAPLDRLADGTGELAGGTVVLDDGLNQVRRGALQLAGGLEALTRSLPTALPRVDGSARGLSHSVRPELQVDAPVANPGSAFAPNVMLGALWLGAAISAFLIHVRVLPRQARRFHPMMQLLGKGALPAALVLLQALCVFATLRFVLGIPVLKPLVLLLVLGSASLAFLAIVLAAARLFGDAGKALVMVFLALQLSSSGAILPVELSGSLFEHISPWLPMTWAVKAVKACLFGAFESAWLLPWAVLASSGLMALLVASRFGRWRYVRPAEMRPAVEF